jgi:hypothetical protein
VIIVVGNDSSKISLEGHIHEGVNIHISVPTGHREISVCNKGTKQGNFNSIPVLENLTS